MSLNLGNVTQNVSDDISFEDLYIDWLETDQQVINLLNAIEIAEKAKATQSTECIAFAEKLLGCSCEVITEGDSGAVARNLHKNAQMTMDILEKLMSKLESFSKKIRGRKEESKKIKIPKYFKELNNINSVKDLLRVSYSSDTIECPLKDAIQTVYDGLRFGPRHIVRLYDDRSGAWTGIWEHGDNRIVYAKVTGAIRHAVKNKIGTKPGSFIDDYKKTRSVMTRIIKDTRNIIKIIEWHIADRHVRLR